LHQQLDRTPIQFVISQYWHPALRMFWMNDQGKVFGDFDQLNVWPQSRKKAFVCATNDGIYEENLRPLGLYREEGRMWEGKVRKNEKGQSEDWPKSLIQLVGARRFELPTPCTPCKYATRLRYAPTSLLLYQG
jgi:hypothetical protein